MNEILSGQLKPYLSYLRIKEDELFVPIYPYLRIKQF